MNPNTQIHVLGKLGACKWQVARPEQLSSRWGDQISTTELTHLSANHREKRN